VLLLDGDVPPAILARARADAARLAWSDNQANLDGAKPGSGIASPEPDADPAPGLTLILRWRPAQPETG
jgi:uroporphyrin-III C-methyltransferase / precorrin-2 dehydrogenase / sirohydrochlorin ferrochelatase